MKSSAKTFCSFYIEQMTEEQKERANTGLSCYFCNNLHTSFFLWENRPTQNNYINKYVIGSICSEECFNMWLLKQ